MHTTYPVLTFVGSMQLGSEVSASWNERGYNLAKGETTNYGTEQARASEIANGERSGEGAGI